jgi:peptidoglycan L-alanyl-D-glutamate endopeptidase CwlK
MDGAVTALDEKRLALLHPQLQVLAREHFRIAQANGVIFRITSGFRSPEEQAALWAKGRDSLGHVVLPEEVVTWAPPGRSWHEYHLAYDIVILQPGGPLSWDEALDGDMDGIRDWQEVGVAGELAGLEWGGRWPRRKKDMPHFQLTRGLTLSVAAFMTGDGHPIPADYFA